MSRGFFKGVRAALFFAILLTALAMVSTATPANAASYFVNIATGTDAVGHGLSPADPWRTLHYAISQLSANGDVLNLAPGVYSFANGESNAALSTPVDNATIYGNSGGGTIIDGTGASNWTSGFLTDKLHRIHLAYLTIRNFSVAGVYLYDTPATAPSSMVSACDIHNNAYGVKVERAFVGTSVARIEGNKIHNNSAAGIFINALVSTITVNVDIVNNLIYANNVGIEADNTGPGSVIVTMIHNTIDGGDAGILQITPTAVTGSILYNIITNAINGISLATPGLTSDYNDVWNCSTPYSGLSAGPFDISANPLFTPGYRLNAGSPCLDKATTSITTVDLDGTARPIGSFSDLGCYEGALANYSLTFAPGSTAADFVIKSIPCNLDNPTALATFGPYIGTYDTTQMRMGHWESDLQAYMEYPGDNGQIYAGDAAWFLFRNGMTIPLSGTPAGTSPAPYPPNNPSHAVMLSHGWNQIGNPFYYPISVAGNDLIIQQMSPTPDVEPLSGGTLTQGIFWVWVNGAYLSASKLNATMGGWIYFNGDMGYAWFHDQSVPYPLVEREAPEFQTVDLSVARPPSPPGVLDSGASAGGGGGGGCFIGQPDRRE